MSLSLNLLGEFEVRDETGAVLSLPTRKTRALLGYLAVNADRPQPRERLMALLWSDRSERQARHSLNQALLAIRRLDDGHDVPLLDSDAERVTLRGGAIESDLGQFCALLTDDPAKAANLYHGPFLEGLSIPDPGFEEWLTATRTELHGFACDALERAGDAAARDGDSHEVIELMRRLVALDPLREDAHRRLMQFMHKSGDRAGALRQYQACADILRRDLQVEPNAATKALYEDIRNDASTPVTPEGPTFRLESWPTETPPALPDKPSIAVLPFDNLGGDPAQDFFGDGIAEDIITELSRFHSLFVIARGSSFSFKGQSLDTREIAVKLGVRYVLEGSVRTQGSHIRITAQLIDAEHGQHLWSERYDRETENLFKLQDEITGEIVRIIEPTISEQERQRARLNAPNRLDAWTLFQKGMTHYYGATASDYDKALVSFQDAIHADPHFAAAFAMRADTSFRQALHGKPAQRSELLARGLADAEAALRLDSRDARSHYALGRVKTLLLEKAAAVLSIDKALELNPNFAMAHFARGYVVAQDNPTGALEYFDRAQRLSPYDPMYSAFLNMRARVLFTLERYEEAVESAQLACQYPNPRIWPFLYLAMALKRLQRNSKAQAALQDCIRRFPELNMRYVEAATAHYNADFRRTVLKVLQDLGLPE